MALGSQYQADLPSTPTDSLPRLDAAYCRGDSPQDAAAFDALLDERSARAPLAAHVQRPKRRKPQRSVPGLPADDSDEEMAAEHREKLRRKSWRADADV